jgi:hypothetical protein
MEICNEQCVAAYAYVQQYPRADKLNAHAADKKALSAQASTM